jgi:hypothetical protein
MVIVTVIAVAMVIAMTMRVVRIVLVGVAVSIGMCTCLVTVRVSGRLVVCHVKPPGGRYECQRRLLEASFTTTDNKIQ